MLGKQAGRTLLGAAAVLICVGAGVGAGRLPIWDQLAHRVASGSRASHTVLGTTGSSAFAPVGASRVAMQGLKVHGWWTIKVLDHGRLVINRQFENSLVTGTNASGQPGGDSALSELLTRGHTGGPWKLDTGDPNGAVIFVLSSAPNAPENGPLNVDGASTEGHVILSGQYTPNSTVTIASVNTFVFLCSNSTTPVNCTSTAIASQFNFTSAALPPASQVTVNGGQVVQIKVDISFS